MDFQRSLIVDRLGAVAANPPTAPPTMPWSG